MEPWRRKWLDRYVNREAFEFKILGVVVLFLGTYMAVQEGQWLALPAGVLGAWLFVAVGDSYRRAMQDLTRDDSEP